MRNTEKNIHYLNWEETNFTWDTLFMNWEVVLEVFEIVKKGGGSQAYIDGNPWDVTKRQLGEEKTKKFFEIFCFVNGLEYKKVVTPNKKIKITVEQLEKVFNESIKVDVKINKK